MNPVIFDSTPEAFSIPDLKRAFQTTTNIGLRPTQEDRLVLCPVFFREDASFCGIFDGTVGDDASHFIQRNIIKHICSCDAIRTGEIFKPEPVDTLTTDAYAEKIGKTLRDAFLGADSALIAYCTQSQLHYASSTGVTAFLW
jgi:serine/threonine protein phosphatase PrpC